MTELSLNTSLNANTSALSIEIGRDYEHLMHCLKETKLQHEILFTTDTEGLFEAYLNGIPEEVRQHYNCRTCKKFFDKYGGLATINVDGTIKSVMWESLPPLEYFQSIVDFLAKLVRKSKITGVFYSVDSTYGIPQTGEWFHLAVHPRVIYNAFLTPGQAMAAKLENYKTVCRALADFNEDLVKRALTILKTETFQGHAAVIKQAQWLADLHEVRKHAKNKNNIVWRAVATAPEGFCHPRSSMIGTLLEDLEAGLPLNIVQARFEEKMGGTRYQRPQAAPSLGTIAQAEKLVETLGIARSLERRYAKVDELRYIWRPTASVVESAGSGVFAHLKPGKSASLSTAEAPTVTMTWDKFRRQILPTADSIKYFASPGRRTYCGLVTAEYEDAPPILQWDDIDNRNPVSWYVWANGSYPTDFKIASNAWHDVEGVSLKPNMWASEDKFEHQGIGVIFVIKGMQETKQNGNALFPSILKSELHGVRSVVEAYAQKAIMGGYGEPHAAGILLNKGNEWNYKFKVKTGGQEVIYNLDRWD